MQNIFDKLSTPFKKAIAAAFRYAALCESPNVEFVHLLAGIAEAEGSMAYEILLRSEMTIDKIKKLMPELSKETPDLSKRMNTVKLSLDVEEIVMRATLIAMDKEYRYVGTEHLLLAILLSFEPTLRRYYEELKGNYKRFQLQIAAVIKGTGQFQEVTTAFEAGGIEAEEWLDRVMGIAGLAGKLGASKEKGSALETYGTELTSGQAQKTLDKVVGRDAEIERMMHILCRRFKNNPLLIGEPGVGKTALVEGLAKRIYEGKVPDMLIEKHLWKIDLAAVLAGTIYRGEYEARLKQILDEVKEEGDIILFIDEIHNVIGSGSASGAMDTANILKPSLARGEVHLIGATTFQEYKKHLSSDAAFERRMQVVFVKEPSASESEEILRGIKKYYEDFHDINIHDEAIKSAVRLSERYLTGKFFPDKAIDLLDEAGSQASAKLHSSPEMQLARQCENLIQEVQNLKHEAVMKEAFDYAQKLKEKEDDLGEKLENLFDRIEHKMEGIRGTITEADIRAVVSRLTGIPTDSMDDAEKNKLRNIESELKERIIGQDRACSAITKVVQRGRLGIRNPKRPIGSLLFVGPSGVGKTETAKALAKLLFDKEESLIRIDMSELSERFSISKLIGAPAGYVGYKEVNTLADQVRKNPHSIVLFDEIEKAHSDVYALLLQILEDGHLVDAAGATIDFKNSIIILTSNVGQHLYRSLGPLGFHERSAKGGKLFPYVQDDLMKELEKKFRPEFLNRLDEIIPFEPLTLEHLEKIVQLQLKDLVSRLSPLGIELSLSPLIVKILAEKSQSSLYGARLVRKNIQEMVENQLSAQMLEKSASNRSKTKTQKFFLAAKNKELALERR